MEYLKRPKYHYKPKKGWSNDPNGLVYFDGSTDGIKIFGDEHIVEIFVRNGEEIYTALL